MLLSQPFSKQWCFGVAVFLLQGTLLMMIAFDQISTSKGSTPFDVPYRVPPVVHAGQLLAIIISVATQTDLVTAIVSMLTLSPGQRHYWTTLIKVPEESSLRVWAARIAFPIALELVEGGFVLFTTFVIVISATNRPSGAGSKPGKSSGVRWSREIEVGLYGDCCFSGPAARSFPLSFFGINNS